MCEFVSWVELDNKIHFLTAKQIFGTLRGKELQRFCGNSDDYTGHGAIRHYYKIAQHSGINGECTDFSKPDNFPAEIVRAIKDGKFRGLAIPEELLTQQARAEYEKVRQPARAEYKKVGQQAWAEYEKVEQQAWAEYEKVKQQARAEYEKVRQQAWAEYKKVGQPAFWDLFAIPENRNPRWR